MEDLLSIWTILAQFIFIKVVSNFSFFFPIRAACAHCHFPAFVLSCFMDARTSQLFLRIFRFLIFPWDSAFPYILGFWGYIAGFPQIMVSSRPFILKDGAIEGQTGKSVHEASWSLRSRAGELVGGGRPSCWAPCPLQCHKVSCSKCVPAGGR